MPRRAEQAACDMVEKLAERSQPMWLLHCARACVWIHFHKAPWGQFYKRNGLQMLGGRSKTFIPIITKCCRAPLSWRMWLGVANALRPWSHLTNLVHVAAFYCVLCRSRSLSFHFECYFAIGTLLPHVQFSQQTPVSDFYHLHQGPVPATLVYNDRAISEEMMFDVVVVVAVGCWWSLLLVVVGRWWCVLWVGWMLLLDSSAQAVTLL